MSSGTLILSYLDEGVEAGEEKTRWLHLLLDFFSVFNVVICKNVHFLLTHSVKLIHSHTVFQS